MNRPFSQVYGRGDFSSTKKSANVGADTLYFSGSKRTSLFDHSYPQGKSTRANSAIQRGPRDSVVAPDVSSRQGPKLEKFACEDLNHTLPSSPIKRGSLIETEDDGPLDTVAQEDDCTKGPSPG